MTFREYHFPERIAGVAFDVRMTPDALLALSAVERSGMRNARRLVDVSYELLEDIMVEKFAKGAIDAGEMVIAGSDIANALASRR